MENNITIIDGKNMVLGRFCSIIAKRLLKNEKITIINCENVVIIGKKEVLVNKYKLKLSNKVVKHGPYYSRSSADLVKRSVRNMLPYKKERGVIAFKNLKCFNNIPKSCENGKIEVIENVKIKEETIFNFVKIKEISNILGYNKKGQ